MTTELIKKAKKLGITPEKMAYADLVALGWKPADAWEVVIRVGQTWSKSVLKQSQEEMLLEDGVRRRKQAIEERLAGIDYDDEKDEKPTPSNVADSVSKEQMIRDLTVTRAKMTPGSKEWIDINKMIIDVTRMKQEEIKTEDDTVHVYLPRKECLNCPYK